jgi:AcrR family transcriptional regulator
VPDAVPRTRDALLQQAARLFAERGFRGTSVEDIGAACGVSGPAVYKHFSSKDALLARLLGDISAQLLAGGEEVVREVTQPAAALARLVAFHVHWLSQT